MPWEPKNLNDLYADALKTPVEPKPAAPTKSFNCAVNTHDSCKKLTCSCDCHKKESNG